MRYQLAPLYCRPWTLNGISARLIESHYENNYGAALSRLNVISEEIEQLDLGKTPSVCTAFTSDARPLQRCARQGLTPATWQGGISHGRRSRGR